MLDSNIIELRKGVLLKGVYSLKEDDFKIVEELIKTLIKKYKNNSSSE